MTVARDIVLPPELQGLKVATAELVRAAGGSAEVAAEGYTGRSQQRLSDYGRPNTPDFMPVNVVQLLQERTRGLPGHPHLTRALAAHDGFFLVAKPQLNAALTGDLHAAVARYAGEHGEATARAVAALGDKRVSAEEARAVRLEIQDAIEAAVILDALLGQIAGDA